MYTRTLTDHTTLIDLTYSHGFGSLFFWYGSGSNPDFEYESGSTDRIESGSGYETLLIPNTIFRSVLRRTKHAHPLLYLKGVKYKELLSVLNFMYQGEVNVAQEELNSFLAVAEDLRVKECC